MKILSVRINFVQDDGDDLAGFKFIVPDHISNCDVEEKIMEEYSSMSNNNEKDERNPLTFINHICEKYGWKRIEFDYDIDINLVF